MSYLSATNKYLAISRGLQVDLFDYNTNVLLDIPSSAANDQINGIALSSDSKYLAVTTNIAKQLLVYNLPETQKFKIFDFPRSSSKLRFSTSNSHVLLADKSGDVFSFDINSEEPSKGQKILGHLSLILDILHSYNGKYVISSDRDEKIKVTCYPNTYEIQTYCLGHKEYVNHIEELPHNEKYLLSSSGDGFVKLWDYEKGKLCLSIDTFKEFNDIELRDSFKNKMDEEVPIESLPIIHLTSAKLNENCSVIAVSIHSYDMLLIYSLDTQSDKIVYKLETKLKIEKFPTDILFCNSSLIIYNDDNCNVTFYDVDYSNGNISVTQSKVLSVFLNSVNNVVPLNHFETIKLLFKRKFDNVQEYQERKKQRIEKASIKSTT